MQPAKIPMFCNGCRACLGFAVFQAKEDAVPLIAATSCG